MLRNQNLKLLKNRIEFKSIILNSIRLVAKNKNPIEKIPKDPKVLTSNKPPLIDRAIYSEEEKLNLWKQYNHFELQPTYQEYSKEEQEYIRKHHLDTIQIQGVTKLKEKSLEINPAEQPYNEVYVDGIDNGNFTKVKNLIDEQPQRWYWVDRLMPKLTINVDNFEPNKQYPSGYKVPNYKEPPNLSYFVSRTRNHILPVYKFIEREDERAKTIIRKIDGNIWDLEQEIRTRLEAKHKKRFLTSVDEVKGELIILGNHVFEIVEHLEELGF